MSEVKNTVPENVKRERELIERDYKILLRTFTKIKGKELRWAEKIALRRIVEDTYNRFTHDNSVSLLVEAQERFFTNIIGIPSKGIDPKSRGGLGMNDEEIRNIWLKHERESEML